MSNELEIAAGASAGGFIRRLAAKHAAPPGTPCANCASPLMGPWCYACGQSGEDFHRSIVRLGAEVIESLLHVDGRLWRTLPDLMLRPARLTHAYLEGHRAPQIPPLRLFLVVLLAVFVVGGLTSGERLRHINSTTTVNVNGQKIVTRTRTFADLTPEERADMSRQIGKISVTDGSGNPDRNSTQWLQSRLQRTLADPERFTLILEQWSERFAFLMLPVAAGLLSLLFVFQRRFYLFDHTIFSLHSLSAMGLVIIVQMVLGVVAPDWKDVPFLVLPVHLFVHMRGVYRTSILGTLIRMFLLFIGTLIAAMLLVIGLVAVGLNGMNS